MRGCTVRNWKEWNKSHRLKRVDQISGFTEYEKFENPPEWHHVEALLFKKLVPVPAPKEEYPSGWKPPSPSSESTENPYFVERSRNHMLPVYLQIKQRGVFRYTHVKKVFGDLAKFEEDLQKFLTKRYKSKSKVATRRDEINCTVEVKGDYVIGCREFLSQKGF